MQKKSRRIRILIQKRFAETTFSKGIVRCRSPNAILITVFMIRDATVTLPAWWLTSDTILSIEFHYFSVGPPFRNKDARQAGGASIYCKRQISDLQPSWQSFHQYSWYAEQETTWISLIGWPLKTSTRSSLFQWTPFKDKDARQAGGVLIHCKRQILSLIFLSQWSLVRGFARGFFWLSCQQLHLMTAKVH